jgi:hypothetical protein
MLPELASVPNFKAPEKLRGVCFWLSYKSVDLSRPFGSGCAALVGYFFLHSQSPFCNLCSNPKIINNPISDTISFSKSKARGKIQLQISLWFKEVSERLTVSRAGLVVDQDLRTSARIRLADEGPSNGSTIFRSVTLSASCIMNWSIRTLKVRSTAH